MKMQWNGWRGVWLLMLVSGAVSGATVTVSTGATHEAQEAAATPASSPRLTAADYVQLHRTRSENQPVSSRPRLQKSVLPKPAGQS